MVTMNWSLNGKVQDTIEDIVGDIPIMVKVSYTTLFTCFHLIITLFLVQSMQY